MKRAFSLRGALITALALALLLTACGTDELVKEAYTAAGDSTRPEDLTKSATLRADDDLNVVIVLNAHRRELAVSAVFTAPDGSTYPTDTLAAEAKVGEVLLGLDWEAQNSVPWPDGEWRVEVLIDDEVEHTLTFTVAALADPTSAG